MEHKLYLWMIKNNDLAKHLPAINWLLKCNRDDALPVLRLWLEKNKFTKIGQIRIYCLAQQKLEDEYLAALDDLRNLTNGD